MAQREIKTIYRSLMIVLYAMPHPLSLSLSLSLFISLFAESDIRPPFLLTFASVSSSPLFFLVNFLWLLLEPWWMSFDKWLLDYRSAVYQIDKLIFFLFDKWYKILKGVNCHVKIIICNIRIPEKFSPGKMVLGKMVLGKMVPGKNGSRKNGPRKNGPREKWSPKNGPRKMALGKNGPRKIGSRKNGHRKNGPREKWSPGKMVMVVSFNLNIRVPLESVKLFLHVFLYLKVILTMEHYIKLLTIFIWKFAIFWSWELALASIFYVKQAHGHQVWDIYVVD